MFDLSVYIEGHAKPIPDCPRLRHQHEIGKEHNVALGDILLYHSSSSRSHSIKSPIAIKTMYTVEYCRCTVWKVVLGTLRLCSDSFWSVTSTARIPPCCCFVVQVNGGISEMALQGLSVMECWSKPTWELRLPSILVLAFCSHRPPIRAFTRLLRFEVALLGTFRSTHSWGGDTDRVAV